MKPARLLATLIAAAALLGAASPPKRVTIDASTVRRLGIRTAPAMAATQSNVVTAFAKVLDPAPLAQLDADIMAARPAAFASEAEAARSRALYAADATISRKASEAATMQAAADSSKLRLLRRRLGLEWGPAIAAMSDAGRARLINRLASGQAALVRIDSSGGAGLSGVRSVRLDFGSLGAVDAAVLGPARIADPRLQSPGLLAQVSGAKAGFLSSGLSVPARIATSGPLRGALVPASALLRLSGATWAFVQVAPGAFERRRLSGAIARTEGLFVPFGIRAGDAVVVSGASQLYAAEQGGGAAGD